ncbi:hypothetical protein NHX12_020302, partial [Muraenolepis orangiensis]
MEVSLSGGQRPPHLMVGEDEALRQFFDGESAASVLNGQLWRQDVTQVLESSVAVDTSILEQYLSNNFMLPESPPDSEPCSPPQVSDRRYQRSHWSTPGDNRENAFQPIASHPAPSSCRFKAPSPAPSDRCEPLTHTQLQSLALPHAGPHPDSPGQQQASKRRRACSGEVSPDALYSDSEGGGAGTPGAGLTWDPYQPEQWHRLSDSSSLAFHVETDKGFVFSPADEAFVCQKKNHFQVTVHVGVAGEPHYVATETGAQPISRFLVNVFGVKQEASSQQVTIEQSQADRSKRAFNPTRISLPGNKITKVLPDAEPDCDCVLLAALWSERIIVRASNPGQFEVDSDTLWQRGALQEAVVWHGRVGINTDSPDEALVVCGNAKVMGAVMHPSDRRAKDNIQEVNSEDQLRRITQMRIVEYDYKPEFASSMGIDHIHQTGIIAQEVKELLPAAVTDVGDVTFSDGEQIPCFLMVDKEQIFMENVGAVKQLCKLTDNLDHRIKELEGWNGRLARLKSLTGSLRSKGKATTHVTSPTSASPTPAAKNKSSHVMPQEHKVFQVSIFTLLTTMALCVISITALYLLTLGKDRPGFPDDSESSVLPVGTTPASTPGTYPTHWPPEVSFCDLLYCDQVFCCPLEVGGGSDRNDTSVPSTEDPSLGDEEKNHIFEQLKRARDWTNTTIHSFTIKENQQVIDNRYLDRNSCGPGQMSYRVPISQYVPVNMRISLLMDSTELLVVYLCAVDESVTCDMDKLAGTRYPSNTQGVHEWALHVARLHHSSYHFRSTVA